MGGKILEDRETLRLYLMESVKHKDKGLDIWGQEKYHEKLHY